MQALQEEPSKVRREVVQSTEALPLLPSEDEYMYQGWKGNYYVMHWRALFYDLYK